MFLLFEFYLSRFSFGGFDGQCDCRAWRNRGFRVCLQGILESNVSLGIDMESPAGYAFHTGQIVISNHLQEETRFRTPSLLADHGVKRAINVLIARGGEGHLPFGVLEVDSPDAGQFDLADADFLAGFAGLLGIAIERQQATPSFAMPSNTRPC